MASSASGSEPGGGGSSPRSQGSPRAPPPPHSELWHAVARAISSQRDPDIGDARRAAVSEAEFCARLPAALLESRPEQLSEGEDEVWRAGAAALCDAEHQRCVAEDDAPGAVGSAEAAILLLCDVSGVDAELSARLGELVGFYNKRAVKSMERGREGFAWAKLLLGRALGLTARPERCGRVFLPKDARLRLRATTLNNLGCLCRRKGKAHAALKHLETALEIESEIDGPLDDPASTHLNLCAILSQLRQHKVAAKHARAAIDKILAKMGVAEDALDTVPAEQASDARNLMIGYYNLSCCHEAALDAAAPRRALEWLDLAIQLASRLFSGEEIFASMSAHRKKLGKACRAAPAKDDETRTAEPPGSSGGRSARSGRSNRSARQGKPKHKRSQQAPKLPSIARPRIGEMPKEFRPIRPVRPRKPAKPRPAYNFRRRKRRAQQPPREHDPGWPEDDDDASLPWHLALGNPAPPPPNTRLLTTMELHMVHDAAATRPSPPPEPPRGLPPPKRSGRRRDAGAGGGAEPPSAAAGSDNAVGDDACEARAVFTSLAQGQAYLHRMALCEVLVAAYRRSGHTGEAKSAVERLMCEMTAEEPSATQISFEMFKRGWQAWSQVVSLDQSGNSEAPPLQPHAARTGHALRTSTQEIVSRKPRSLL